MALTTRPLTRLLLIALLAASGLTAGVTRAAAHAALLSSDPKAGSTVTELDKVSFTFNEAIGEKFAEIKVLDSAGRSLTTGEAKVDGPKVSQTVDASQATAGTFKIAYRVVSEDGHPISDQFEVNYKPTAEATPSASATAAAPTTGAAGSTDATSSGSSDADSKSGPGLVIGLGALALVAGLAAGWFGTRGRSRKSIDRA